MSGTRFPIGTPGLEAGARGRRLRHFMPPRAHINSLISASGRTVLDRARYLVRNNPYAANAVDYFAGHVVGTGITPSWKSLADDPARKQAVSAAWLRWTDEADAEALTDFYGLQRRAARELFIAGEVFIRLRPRRPGDGLSVPLQLQMLPAEMLPVDDNRILGNGNTVRQGIEFDAIGQRVAYHFYRSHPDDSTVWRQADGTGQTRVPADQVLHILDPVEGGQVRGFTRFGPAIVPLWLLDLYDDAELDRKRTAALFSVFRRRPTEMDETEVHDEGDGTASQEMAPGAQIVLPPGEDITIANPADVGGSYEAFQYRNLLRAAAGVGVPYVGLTGDMVRANYSNMRAAMLDFRRRAEAFQHGVMVFLLCRPVVNAWVRAAGLAGAIDGMAAAAVAQELRRLTNVRWMPPRWEWVDPAKDVKAAKEEVDAGFRSRSSVIESRGEDPAEVDREIAEERARELRLRLAETPTSFGAKPAAAPPAPPPAEREPETEDAPDRPAQEERDA